MEYLIIPLLLGCCLVVVYTISNGIGPSPTSPKVIKALDELLPEKNSGKVIELGAGWGGVTAYLSEKYPESTVIAVENSPAVWLVCWLRSKLLRLHNVRVQYGSIYQKDLSQAGLVYCYLFPGAMKKLASQFQKMPCGSVVISHTFSLPDQEPERFILARDLWRSRIYRYRLSQ